MISKLAVKKFTERKLRDSRKAKRWSTKELDAAIERLGARFTTEPKQHQKACFLLGVLHPGYVLLLDPGLGKTKITLDLFVYHKRQAKKRGEKYRGLVLVPYGSNVPQWVREAKKHAPNLRVLGVTGDREQRQEVLDSDADLVVCTYMGWLSLSCERVKVRGEKKKTKLVPTKYTDKLCKRFQFAVYDECSFISNRQSTTFKVLRRMLKTTTHRYALTGTPFGLYPEDLWAQFFLVDGGETLGKTLGLYRAVFFKEKKRFWGSGFDYEFDESKRKLLNRVLRHGSIRYAERECFDLPPIVEMKLPVSWPEEAWAYYEKLLDRLQHAQEKEDRKKVENVFVRMRQLASGFISVKGPQGETIDVHFDKNPKLDTLVEKLKELPAGRKAIVYNEYKKSGAKICARLKQEKIRHIRLFSGTTKKVKDTLEQRFTDEPKLQVLVTSQSGAFGLNLQAANYLWIYESPVDPKTRKQLMKRAHRQGQTRRVFVTDIYVKNSIEEKILKYVAKGESLFQAIVEGRVEVDGFRVPRKKRK